MYYPVYNGPVYYNTPILPPVDDATLQDCIKKQMYETSSSLPPLFVVSAGFSLLPVSITSVMRTFRKTSSSDGRFVNVCYSRSYANHN